ncbi:gamma-glutamyltransferase [Congregibacter litoralis]|uniref:Glutathione hydrolase proenzyme n=1 Tax=Congregibacter litoralis KT71 TaxID=314285 RepID=A4A6I5_9GAMM|nr:gamma-glutamyltransferase [Congregibacter litoralis]EAQ98632.2 putative threonine peptidase [Congregibacter litoralis KT71]
MLSSLVNPRSRHLLRWIFAPWVALCFACPSPTLGAGEAAIASPEPQATEIGLAVLRKGGNAVDAAVAVAFALAVTLPDAGNIGGGGFMMVHVDGEAEFLDYRERAPAAAFRDMYLDETGAVNTDASLTGHRAVGVPGTVAGLWAAHRRYGVLPWASLVEPAIALAEQGFVVPRALVDEIDYERERLRDAKAFIDSFGQVEAGQLLVQRSLAETLQRIAARGARGFYEGETAELIEAEMQRGGGLITREDLASYEVRWRSPLTFPWRGYEVVTAPLPSSGGLAIFQYLTMKEWRRDDFAGLAHNSPQYIHLKAEIEKRIFADRARFLGDADYVDVPMDALLDPARLKQRAATIDPVAISPTESVNAVREPIHTTHFSILDSDGNAVSNTYTLNTSFGSGVVVSGAGFLLNNEMDDFSAAPNQPNYYGVVGDEANAIAPGKRMLSSMSPTLLLRGDEIAMALGAMGGSTIFTTVYQLISNIVEFAMSGSQAQAATRVHHQLLPKNLITYSPTTPLAPATIQALERRGYRVEPHPYEFGNVQLIWRTEDGPLTAVSDPRFGGTSAVITLPGDQ